MTDAVGAFHAVSLIALPVLTVVACAIGGGRPTARRAAVGLAAAAILTAVAALAFRHRCLAGAPLVQWLIPGICLAALAVCMRRPAIAAAASVPVAALMFFLCMNYAEVVHGPDYGGSYAQVRFVDRGADSTLRAVKIALAESSDVQEYPAGRLKEAPFLGTADLEPINCEWYRLELSPLWHTRLTGLYRSREVRRELWYPGGVPAQGAAGIEWRDR